MVMGAYKVLYSNCDSSVCALVGRAGFLIKLLILVRNMCLKLSQHVCSLLNVRKKKKEVYMLRYMLKKELKSFENLTSFVDRQCRWAWRA